MRVTDEQISVVIAGGGVAALEAALTLRELGGDRVRLTLVSPSRRFRLRTLDVGVPFGLGKPAEHDLELLVRTLEAELVEDALAEVATDAREIVLASGRRLGFDRLVIAVGALPRAGSPFGIVFDQDSSDFAEALSDLRAGLISHVAFAVPAAVTWPLPLYELALMTAAWGAALQPDGVRVTLVSHERRPLEMFGAQASGEVAARLDRAGVAFAGGHDPLLVSDTFIRSGAHQLVAERIVVLPELAGPALAGLPHRRGFLPVDAWGRVEGAPGVIAVGDVADHPVKQGGLAAQQATAAAQAIAAELAGEPAPGVGGPVLRGLLRTTDGPLYLRAVMGDEERTGTASPEPLWWPPAKLAAPRLTGLLGRIERELSQGIVLPAARSSTMALLL